MRAYDLLTVCYEFKTGVRWQNLVDRVCGIMLPVDRNP